MVVTKNLEAEIFSNWLRSNYTSPIYDLLAGVSETSSINPLERNSTTALQLGGNRNLGIVDPKENTYNTLFHQKTIGTQSASSLRGFRTVIYVTK